MNRPIPEPFHILGRAKRYSDAFKMLDVNFDCKLILTDTVHILAKDAQWKLKAALRTIGYMPGIQLIDVYKS